MNESLAWFWAAMVFSSIAWYAFLLFYLGAKGGREIVQMTRTLSDRGEDQQPQGPSEPSA